MNRYAVTTRNGHRVTRTLGQDTIIKNVGGHFHHLFIGIATLGVIRYEWHVHRKNQIIPINWQAGETTAAIPAPSLASMDYDTADAQNVIVTEAMDKHYEWVLLWEDDVLPPMDGVLRMVGHAHRKTAPIISGLYYSKCKPSWPLTFRGRGTGTWLKWKPGGMIWCDGVPTGFLMIHHSIIQWFQKNSPLYKLPDGTEAHQIFRAPREAFYDPEKDAYFQRMGTSDLHFCDEIMKRRVLEKTGWKRLAKQRYPFPVDTRICCTQIDLQGRLYPQHIEHLHPTGGDPFEVKPDRKRRIKL